MEKIEEFYSASKGLVEQFNLFAKKIGLENIARSDHICYKCGNATSFNNIRAILEDNSDYLHQSIISKRRIAYIKLKKGIETSLGTIYFVELSDQKPDGSQQEGFDHIEVYPISISYDGMIKILEKTEKVIKVERPHHTTHDIGIGENFVFRCSLEPLLEKIKREEMA